MAIKASTMEIIEAIKGHEIAGEKVTAADIADETGYTVRQVNGVMTMTICEKNKNDYGFREPAQVKLEDGTVKEVKFLRMTQEGLDHDFDATPADK